MVIGRLTKHGRTTIPPAVRTALGLCPGDRIAYVVEAGRAVIARFDELPLGDGAFAAFFRMEQRCRHRSLWQALSKHRSNH